MRRISTLSTRELVSIAFSSISGPGYPLSFDFEKIITKNKKKIAELLHVKLKNYFCTVLCIHKTFYNYQILTPNQSLSMKRKVNFLAWVNDVSAGALLSGSTMMAQKSFRGKVTDAADGLPLPSVTIIVREPQQALLPG
jgi:hypothetical protein